MKKKALSLLLAGALLLGTCTGCGDASSGSAGDTAAQEDTSSVVVAMGPTSEPEAGFDPAFGWGAGEHVHEPLIQSTLTVTNTDLTIGYDLATDIATSEDGLTWTVTIRDDVSFTDGEPLTAADVAFTYNTVKASSSVNDFTMLYYAEATDDTTVVFHMTRAFSIWPYTMAVVGIVPEHAYDSATYGSNPKQWDRGQQVILEANPDYYGQAPTMERVTILFMEEDAAFWRPRPARWTWPTPPPPIPTRAWRATPWPPTKAWTTGALTFPLSPPGAPTKTAWPWATTSPATCGCAGP